MATVAQRYRERIVQMLHLDERRTALIVYARSDQQGWLGYSWSGTGKSSDFSTYRSLHRHGHDEVAVRMTARTYLVKCV